MISKAMLIALVGVMRIGISGVSAAGPSVFVQAAKTETQESREKAAQEARKKLFQLNPVTIDVVEALRDKEMPNMTVVKTALFPMTIGVTLETALSRMAGVDVQRLQEVGAAADDDSIKIRGLGARRIKVLRDGRPLNSSGVAGGYFIDWTMIPLASAERVEVIKGVGDPRYGNVLGGVINLVPKRPTDRMATELQTSAASFGTFGLNLQHDYKPGAFEYSLSAGYSRSDGYLRNGRMRSANARLHLGYDFSFKGRLSAELAYAEMEKGFTVGNRASKAFGDPLYETPLEADYPASDGEIMYGAMGAVAEPGSRWTKTKWTADVNYEQAFGDWGFASVRYWRNRGDRDALNTRLAANRRFHKIFYDDRSEGLSAGYKHFWPNQTVSFGLDYSHLNDDGDANLADDFRAPFRNDSYVSTKNLEFFLMDEIRWMDGKISVLPGVRYLSYNGVAGPSGLIEGIPDLKRSGWAPSLKIVFNYASEALVYVSAARALRMPTAPEHFWHYDVDAGVDTSDLPFREEDGLLLQGGWRASFPTGTQIEIAPYYYRIKNYIQFDLINFVAYNIGRADLLGLEIEASQDLGRGWTAFANYTFQTGRTRGDDFVALFVNPADRDFREIPSLPAHKANLGAQYRWGRGASVALFLQATSNQKVIYNDNTLYNTNLRVRTQKGFARLDFEARHPIAGAFEAGLFVRNILGAIYQERFGYPAAGRNAGISFRAKF